MTRRVAADLDEVIALFDRWADDPYDEEITQREHAEQCAALAVADGAAPSLVAAALLHDVGHLLSLDGGADGPDASNDLGHEGVGAAFLAGVFGPEVTAPISLHVRAKRYRCAVDPAYEAGLSSGSRHSLMLQGGPAHPGEVERFESNPGFADAVVLRSWDDGGKVDGLEVRPFADYLPMLRSLAR